MAAQRDLRQVQEQIPDLGRQWWQVAAATFKFDNDMAGWDSDESQPPETSEQRYIKASNLLSGSSSYMHACICDIRWCQTPAAVIIENYEVLPTHSWNHQAALCIHGAWLLILSTRSDRCRYKPSIVIWRHSSITGDRHVKQPAFCRSIQRCQSWTTWRTYGRSASCRGSARLARLCLTCSRSSRLHLL